MCHFPKLLNCVSTLTVTVWRQKYRFPFERTVMNVTVMLTVVMSDVM